MTAANLQAGWAEQDVSAKLDYAQNWGDFLIGSDSISISNWAASDPSISFSNAIIGGAITSVFIEGGVAGQLYRISNTITTAQGRRDVRYFMLSITDVSQNPISSYTSALFTNRFEAINRLRKDRSSLFSGVTNADALSDDYLWDKILAAESEARGRLTVPLTPTKVFCHTPTADEITALGGIPYVTEPGYDLPADFFGSQSWGAVNLRICPVISVDSMQIVYPSQTGNLFEIPKEWIRIDNKYGAIHVIPGPGLTTAPLSVFMVQAISSGNRIPHVLKIDYTAGINSSHYLYASIKNTVSRLALVSVMHDLMLPSSGSISADGLSQSVSYDVTKLQGDVDNALDNLKQELLGTIWGVL